MSKLTNREFILCEVCGSRVALEPDQHNCIKCHFCKFGKKLHGGDKDNLDLVTARNVNIFFKLKYGQLEKGETFQLDVPVIRFYAKPKPLENQVNFFKSKNIMFLLEQHGFHMVSRESRFSTRLRLVIRKI